MKKFSIVLVAAATLCIISGASTVSSQTYEGTLRVYMVEPESRWVYNNGGAHIGQAVMDIPIVVVLDIPGGSTASYSIQWDASANGFNGVTADNFAAAAAVFQANCDTIDSYPPYGYMFERHIVDASATATPGSPGMNVAEGDYTHSVFCEEATQMSCVSCPTMAANLHASHEILGSSLNYVALVEDMDESNVARVRLAEYYSYGYPKVFFDGGLEIQVIDTSYAFMQTNLATVGANAVNDVGLVLRVDHVASDRFLVTVRIGNGVAANGAALTPDAPTGDGSGAAEDTLNFQAVSTDPDDDDLYFQFDFGDGETSDWLGPYSSGTACPVEHVFASDGQYDVRVRTKDVWAATSELSPAMTITVDVASDVRRRESGRLPTHLALGNYPNPFNPTTIIGFSLPRAERVELTIYNILGERVRTLVDDNLSAGNYEVTWDGTSDRQARVKMLGRVRVGSPLLRILSCHSCCICLDRFRIFPKLYMCTWPSDD